MRGSKVVIAATFLAAMASAVWAPAGAVPARHSLIPGGVYVDGKGPDGNTVILDAPQGLIVVDTGRHPAHVGKILDFARSSGKPIAAIINTHWHFDHTTGNWEVIEAFPKAKIVASRAIDGQLFKNFVKSSRAGAEGYLKSGQASEAQKVEIARGFRAMDNLQLLRASRPVVRSGPMMIAGRRLDVRLARFAASEGDVWLVVPEEKMVISGDLVVDVVPFMDTACVDGWSKALREIAALKFDTLIPGHGAPMTKPQFLQWKGAFDGFVDCARSKASADTCVEGWMTNAAPFIDEAHKQYAREAGKYYLDSRLRSNPAEQQKFCAPPKV